jgi:L-2-hydroxyglutarate oxidase LhgO
MESVECVVIGAGVVGLAVARALVTLGRETLVLERHPTIGWETSSRNSEVIHAGLHYPAGSLKALTCVRGREQLYSYCESRGVAYERCGKLIVATNRAQIADLARIRDAAQRNGVSDLKELNGREVRALEPELACVGALLSPSTGILDTHGYMLALQGDAEAHGATFAFRTPVAELKQVPAGVAVRCEGTVDDWIQSRWVVNSAGLGAVQLATRTEGYPLQRLPRAYFAKGSYFSLAGRAPFDRLVYPVPEPGGLGVHLTLDLAGQARFGPDVEWVDSIDYRVDPQRSERFYGAIRSYWPSLPAGALQPAYSGIRPKISGPGEPARDFVIEGPEDHGVAGLINLLGIESPGLTSSLSIAEHVAAIIKRG